jgi:hypothetical protein
MHPKWFLSQWYVQHKPWTYLPSRLMVSFYGPKWDFTWPMSRRSTIGCAQNDFQAYGMFSTNRAPIMHRDQHCLQTNLIELPFHPCHLGVPSGASKIIFMPMVHLVQTVHLSCVKINTIPRWTKRIIHFTHVTKEIYPCAYLSQRLTLCPNGPKRASTWLTSPRSTSRCAWHDFHARGTHSAQTVHVSCVKIKTIPKRIETSFLWTNITSTIGYVQNDFHARGTFGTNHAPILRRD